MTRRYNPDQDGAVTKEQWDAQRREEMDRTAPHGFDWRRPYTEAEEQERAEAVARHEAEWTKEVTQARRAEWNALVKSGALTGTDGKVSALTLCEQERRQGWIVEDLKAAVKRHGL